MCTDNFNARKSILEGRIYPAIRDCVRNRYHILVGMIGYAFILQRYRSGDATVFYLTLIFGFILLLFATILNSINYAKNVKTVNDLENDPHVFSFRSLPPANNTMNYLFMWFSIVFLLVVFFGSIAMRS